MIAGMLFMLSGFLFGGGIAANAESPPGTKYVYDAASGEWTPVESPRPGTPEGDLLRAAQLNSRREYARAKSVLKKWIKSNGTEHPQYGRALVTMADSEIGLRNFGRAHKLMKQFREEYQAHEALDDALQNEFVIAEAFLNGEKRKFLGVRMIPSRDLGVEILDEISTDFPDFRIAELAYKTKADSWFRNDDYRLAEDEYVRLIRKFPRSQWARYSLKRSADSALASFGGIQYDDAALIEADFRYRDYLNKYPVSGEQEGIGLLLQQIHESRGRKELAVGDYYAKVEQPRAANIYYQYVIDHYPDTVAASIAIQRIAGAPDTIDAPKPVSPDESVDAERGEIQKALPIEPDSPAGQSTPPANPEEPPPPPVDVEIIDIDPELIQS